jgi:hypothetical protein
MREWKNIYSVLDRSKQKYAFYSGSYDYKDFIDNAKIVRQLAKQKVGWGKRAVEVRANKMRFDQFENDTLGLNDIFAKYRVPEALEKLKDDVLVCGCGFLAVNGDRVFPFTAEEATGEFGFYDQNLTSGLAVYRKHRGDTLLDTQLPPDSYVEYYSDVTVVHEIDEKGKKFERVENNVTRRPLIGLLTYRGTTRRPFGQSVLSRAARSAIIDASRTVRQAMIAAHYYNTKVDVILGADSETPVDKIDGKTGDILKIGPNDNGQIPQIGELAQHAMAPFNDTILTAAKNFCSDTKLSLANLGISTDAPQSSESLEIVNDDLKDDIISWERELADQLLYFAVTLFMHENGLRDLDDNLREKVRATKPVFYSVYRQDVSKFGDGLNKIAIEAPDIAKTREIWRGLGLSSKEIDMVINSVGQKTVGEL